MREGADEAKIGKLDGGGILRSKKSSTLAKPHFNREVPVSPGAVQGTAGIDKQDAWIGAEH
jgi:hypothetical protein